MSELIWPNGKMRICMSFKCNFKCDYCSIDHFQEDLCRTNLYHGEEKTSEEWCRRLSDLKVKRYTHGILGAGEPALFPGFAEIVNVLGTVDNLLTVIYTNASTKSLEEFRRIPPRDDLVFYVSYHPTRIKVDEFADNFKWIKSRFKVIDCHTPEAPENEDILPGRRDELARMGVELAKAHPYLVQRPGEYSFYGEYGESKRFKDRFMSRVGGVPMRKVLCKTSFNHAEGCNTMSYPIAPNGNVYTCWRYLFNHSDEGILGNIFDQKFKLKNRYYECNYYGDCNMCAWDKNIVDVETGRQLDSDVVERAYLW